MNVKLYLQLENFNDGDFDVRNDYYASDEEFFAAAEAENKKYSNVAYDAVSNLGNLVGNRTAKFGQVKVNTKNANQYNYMAEAILFDEDKNDETVDKLITDCVSQDVVVSIIKFNRDSMDEEFEEDFNFWVDEHLNINKYKNELGEDKVWKNEPVRTFKLEFINNAGEVKHALLENCRILDKEGDDEYSILSEKITLIDSL